MRGDTECFFIQLCFVFVLFFLLSFVFHGISVLTNREVWPSRSLIEDPRPSVGEEGRKEGREEGREGGKGLDVFQREGGRVNDSMFSDLWVVGVRCTAH